MKSVISIPAICLAGAALAHTGATGVTLERMQGMSAMADALKALAPSVIGDAPHNPALVQETARILSSHSGAVMVDLFVEGTGVAPSQATALVWQDAARFARLAQAMDAQADALAAAAASPTDTALAFRAVGQACSACHEDFRSKSDGN